MGHGWIDVFAILRHITEVIVDLMTKDTLIYEYNVVWALKWATGTSSYQAEAMGQCRLIVEFVFGFVYNDWTILI